MSDSSMWHGGSETERTWKAGCRTQPTDGEEGRDELVVMMSGGRNRDQFRELPSQSPPQLPAIPWAHGMPRRSQDRRSNCKRFMMPFLMCGVIMPVLWTAKSLLVENDVGRQLFRVFLTRDIDEREVKQINRVLGELHEGNKRILDELKFRRNKTQQESEPLMRQGHQIQHGDNEARLKAVHNESKLIEHNPSLDLQLTRDIDAQMKQINEALEVLGEENKQILEALKRPDKKAQQQSELSLRQERQQPPADREPVRNTNNIPDSPGLDFAVIGFPKTGTTFLLYVLEHHKEIVMPPQEFCQIHQKSGDRLAMEWLQNVRAKHPPTSEVARKYGIKCPTMVRHVNAIDNLVKMSLDTRLVLGLRHPVRFFESFYNYRVLENYNQGINETIPTPFELADGRRHWRDASTAFARYDLFMRQLGKVFVSQREMYEMLTYRLYEKSVSPNPFKVFVYHAEQLRDKDKAREARFQADLKEFLGLKTPLMDFDQVPKVNEAANTRRRPEMINICEPRYDGIRAQLIESGRKASAWIRDRFMKSPDVVVSSEEYFRSILGTWGEDPCK